MKQAKGLIKLILKSTGFSGIALPPFGIYILEEKMYDERLQKHEAEHWKQYKENGLVKFYTKYLWYSLRYGYKNNPWEIQARNAET